MNIMKPPGGEA